MILSVAVSSHSQKLMFKDENSWIYCKPTYTGLITKYKGNLICTWIYRAYQISENHLIFCRESTPLQLRKNGFSTNFSLRDIKKTSNKIIIPTTIPLTAIKDMYIELPYFGSISSGFERKLNSIIRKQYPTVDLQIIYQILIHCQYICI